MQRAVGSLVTECFFEACFFFESIGSVEVAAVFTCDFHGCNVPRIG